MARQYWNWLCGQYTDSPTIALHSSGVQTGYGVFETIYFKDGVLSYLADHLDRLSRAAVHYGLDFSPPSDVPHIVATLAEKNELHEARVRLTLLGAGEPSGSSRLSITIAPYKRVQRAVSLVSAPAQKFGCPLGGHKTTSYSSYLLAKRYAAAEGADDTLLSDAHGNAIECSTSNIFFLNGEQWETPCLSQYGLPGIQRQKTLDAMNALGIDCLVRPITEPAPDFAFVTNSLIGLQEVHRIDQRVLTPTDSQRNHLTTIRHALADMAMA